jgi:hypothetical protein
MMTSAASFEASLAAMLARRQQMLLRANPGDLNGTEHLFTDEECRWMEEWARYEETADPPDPVFAALMRGVIKRSRELKQARSGKRPARERG